MFATSLTREPPASARSLPDRWHEERRERCFLHEKEAAAAASEVGTLSGHSRSEDAAAAASVTSEANYHSRSSSILAATGQHFPPSAEEKSEGGGCQEEKAAGAK